MAFAQVVGACLGFVCPVAGNQVAVFPDFGSYILRGGVVFDVVYYVAAAGLLGEADTFLLEMILVADGEGEGEGFLRGVVSEEDLQFAAVGADEGEFVRMAVDYDAAVVEQSAGGGALAGTVRGVERATEGGEAGYCSAFVDVVQLPFGGVEAEGEGVTVSVEGGFGEGEADFVYEDVSVAGMEQKGEQEGEQGEEELESLGTWLGGEGIVV